VVEGYLGDFAILNAGVKIEGHRVEIGREAYFDRGAYIGGGSCYSTQAFLKAGDWLHMGTDSQINTAMGVTLGHSVGVGINTKIFTHGAYIDSFGLGAPVQWAPVSIGNNVWLPNAWVNPGVVIGDNVVVAAMSLINRNIPSGSLAGGVPVKILKENYLPKILSQNEELQLVSLIESQCKARPGFKNDIRFAYNANVLSISEDEKTVTFNLKDLVINGVVTEASIEVKDQLRRNGIRFRFESIDGLWRAWKK
jgi:acetyltransferase-like isoleucine patch superfamily enzyme